MSHKTESKGTTMIERLGRHGTRMRLVVALLLVIALGAGVAYAAIPDAGGVIHGCFKKSGGDDDDDGGNGKGSLRVIDTDKGERCKKSETALDWNQRGRRATRAARDQPGPRMRRAPKARPARRARKATPAPPARQAPRARREK